nr:hypothetical protein [Tanacetum cinerariifolium]
MVLFHALPLSISLMHTYTGRRSSGSSLFTSGFVLEVGVGSVYISPPPYLARARLGFLVFRVSYRFGGFIMENGVNKAELEVDDRVTGLGNDSGVECVSEIVDVDETVDGSVKTKIEDAFGTPRAV